MTIDARLFLKAQNPVWANVIRELTVGQKTSHWMWFVFPQLAALGRSATAKRYGLANLAEAQSYIDHPTLRARLSEAATLMLTHAGQPPETILGNIDALKLCSSMTLFSRVPNAPTEVKQVLDAFYGGKPCPLTLTELDR